MWEYSSVKSEWDKKVDNLDKRVFNYLRQEIEDVRYYSKCLDGTTYVPVSDFDSIYDILRYKDSKTYKIDSVYSSKYTGNRLIGKPITRGSISDNGYYYRYSKEYGFTLKNLFTPTKLINDSKNISEVDLATTESINFNNSIVQIDNITLKEGHRVLVKDNISTVSIDSSVDPDEYFQGNYTLISEVGSIKTYTFYNSDNGIYKFTNGSLVREEDLSDYTNVINYSVNVKLGTYIDKEFHLLRLSNGTFPLSTSNDVIEFEERESYVVRNSLEYRNVLDNQFYNGIVQQEESITFNGDTFKVPSRFLGIGDYGFIINYQDGYPNIIYNKNKENINGIVSLKRKYLLVGDNGTLLEMGKVDMLPKYLELDTFQNLRSIDFSDNKRGLIVGDNGTILYTIDGVKWLEYKSDIKNNLNKVRFLDISNAIIVGDNGNVIKVKFVNSTITITKDILLKSPNEFDEINVTEDFRDIDIVNVKKERFKFIGNDWVDIDKSIGDSNFTFDFRFKPTTLNTSKNTLFSFLTTKFPNTSGSTLDIGVKIIIEQDSNGDHRVNMYVNDDDVPTTLIKLEGGVKVEENTWYHILVTRDKNRYSLYVNNSLSDSTSVGYVGNFSNFNTRIRLGAELSYDSSSLNYSSTSTNYFRGSIDHVRLFSKSLDDNEIETFTNNYKLGLDSLISWYKFGVIGDSNSKSIRTKDLVNDVSLILPSLSNLSSYNTINNVSYIDSEEFSGYISSGGNLMSLVISLPTNYADQDLNNQFHINVSTNNIRNIIYNSPDEYFYGVGDTFFRLSSYDIDVDLFNFINNELVSEDVLLEKSYRNIKLDSVSQKLYLIGGSNNEIDEIDISSICVPTGIDPIANCGIYVTVSTIRNTNSLTIENTYRSDVTDSININSIEYIKTLGYPSSTQSVVEVPIKLSGNFLPVYKELYISLSVEDLVDGYFEISLDGNNFTQLTVNGNYLIPLTVGSSILTTRAVLNNNAVGNKVKGKISNIVIYEADCVNLEGKTYTGGNNIMKLYFTQFDTNEQLSKLGTSDLYSYIDIKSLKIDDNEQILSTTYSNNFPKYLNNSSIGLSASSNCDINGLCDYVPSLTNNVIDRVRYGFDLSVDNSGNNYVYNGDSYGLLEAFTINNSQIFGLDRENISNSFENIENPYHIGIDFTKSFRFEVDSLILSEVDLLNSDITNGGSSSNSVEVGTSSFTYSIIIGDYFNQIVFTQSNSLTYDIVLDETLQSDRLYYLEFDLDGDITIEFGTQSFTYSSSGSIINENIRMISDVSTVSITNGATISTVSNFVVSNRLPTKNIIEWDPSVCKLSYRMNGVELNDYGFLLSDGGGQYTPVCSLNASCDNSPSVSEIIGETYLDKFDSKLLFLDYDIASKMYFFDTNSGEYFLPQSVNITDINVLSINSIQSEKSWIDYSKDSTKQFKYNSVKNESDTIRYNTDFTLSSTSSYIVTLNNVSTNNLSDINGATQGLLPNYISGTSSISSPPSSTYSYFFYGKYFIIKNPSFEVSLGDVIRIENSLVTENMMVIYLLEDSGDKYIYLKSSFNNSITNSLVNWVKNTVITNLNRFEDQNDLITNFNNHPVSVGYKLVDNTDGTIKVDPQFNFKTSYFNLQANIIVTNSLLINKSFKLEYVNKFLSFGYTPTYNILDYLPNSFEPSYTIGSLPSYAFTDNNDNVIYTVSTGKLSFNSSLKDEWSSIPKYTFIDMIFDSVTISSVLITNKYYDSDTDRYIIETYDYYGHVYQQSDLDSNTWTFRVRNTLAEISEDLQKLNNIQKSDKTSYFITDLDTNVFTTYNTLGSNLNFKPNTDSYVKALLSQKEIKSYISGILYTDYKNELSFNIVNLPTKEFNVISGLGKYEVDCENCDYDDYSLFESNNISYNQVSIIGSNTYYSNRVPFSTYNYYNNIKLSGATGSTFSDFNIDFVTNSGTNRILEFEIDQLDNSTIQVIKGSNIISTITSIPSDMKSKILFTDNGTSDLNIRVNYTEGNNDISINNIRVGNSSCIDNCYLTTLYVTDHNLKIGDGFYVDITDDIFNLDPVYESEFSTSGLTSGWVSDVDGTTSSIILDSGVISLTVSSTMSIYLPDSITVSTGELYRVEFDYKLDSISGTPSIEPSFGVTSSLTTNFGSFGSSSVYKQAVVNFIPNNSTIFFGFNLYLESSISISNVKLFKVQNVGKTYNGYRVVKDVVSSNQIVINTDYNGEIREISSTFSALNNCGDTVIKTSIDSDLGQIKKILFDPYLNYSPIDIFELGIDDNIKQSIEIKPDDWSENDDNTFSILPTIDLNNFRFRLIDGLSLPDLVEKYPWILEAEIRDALIGQDTNGIVWYNGIWDCGRWFGGTWYSGFWRNGEWYNGVWNNSVITDNKISASIDVLNSNTIQSIWYNGNFRDGEWNGGEFRGGNHYDGIWRRGYFLDGTWHDGQWISGYFKRGTWIDGTWEIGEFSCELGTSIWFDGKWNGGDFLCGIWNGGMFTSKNTRSTFGSNSSLSRKSIWNNGTFVDGDVNSGDNTRHDLTIWNTGYFNNGIWNGGTIYQTIWNNGVFNNGVVKDISVVAFAGDNNGNYVFTLLGEWMFSRNDIFWIINNGVYSSIYGSDDNESRYKVEQDATSINNGQYTKVIVSKVPSEIITEISNNNGLFAQGYVNNLVPTDNTIIGDKITSIVSYLSKVDWYNGRFENGIFEDNFFRDGMFIKGVFKSGQFGY